MMKLIGFILEEGYDLSEKNDVALSTCQILGIKELLMFLLMKKYLYVFKIDLNRVLVNKFGF